MTCKEQIEKILREAFVGKKLAWRLSTHDGSIFGNYFFVGGAKLNGDLYLYPLCPKNGMPWHVYLDISQAIALADEGSLSYVDEDGVERTYTLNTEE